MLERRPTESFCLLEQICCIEQIGQFGEKGINWVHNEKISFRRIQRIRHQFRKDIHFRN